jgi:hypothetical protein
VSDAITPLRVGLPGAAIDDLRERDPAIHDRHALTAPPSGTGSGPPIMPVGPLYW